MRKVSQDELDVILEKHKEWLNDKRYGKRADLSYFDLSHANLSNANLRSSDLCCANLSHADLSNANLHSSDLCYANLTHVNLRNADLQFSYLKNANLRKSNLTYGSLRFAFLSNVDLTGANLRGADLCETTLIGAKLDGVITDGETQGFNLICPEEGSFIGWKKAKAVVNGYVLVKLLIPADAKRSSGTTNKCRASKAKVLEMTLIETGERVSHAYSIMHINFQYRTGEYAYPDSFDENRWDVCSNGIHFFMTKDEAIAY